MRKVEVVVTIKMYIRMYKSNGVLRANMFNRSLPGQPLVIGQNLDLPITKKNRWDNHPRLIKIHTWTTTPKTALIHSTSKARKINFCYSTIIINTYWIMMPSSSNISNSKRMTIISIMNMILMMTRHPRGSNIKILLTTIITITIMIRCIMILWTKCSVGRIIIKIKKMMMIETLTLLII